MFWDENTATERIAKRIKDAPSDSISVSDLDAFVRERSAFRDNVIARGEKFDEPIFSVPRNRAVLTNGVHIYANLMDFNKHLLEEGVETETSHRRSLRFLHTHYSACDQLIREFEIQRVDFHGSRLHAVVLNPTGEANEIKRIEKALLFAAAFRELTRRIVAEFGPDFQTRVRIGIDSGPAVAINSGKKSEPEPLFIGSPANHAAKAADGDDDGVYLSPRAQQAKQGMAPDVGLGFGMSIHRFSDSGEQALLQTLMEHDSAPRTMDSVLQSAFGTVSKKLDRYRSGSSDVRKASFHFTDYEPPLRSIRYQDHPPSNTIRIEMISIFADLDGFTDYVDRAMENGSVSEAVSNLYVIREELSDVLQIDFKGRKVRFIGDCLHGMLAEGTYGEIDAAESVKSSVLLAGALRSSFNLCKTLLPNCMSLGLGIGLEYGVTPVCRVGISGEASVRCSSSRGVCEAELVQQDCGGSETAIGDNAYANAEYKIKQLFRHTRKAQSLSYGSAAALLIGVHKVAAAPSSSSDDNWSPEPVRAFSK